MEQSDGAGSPGARIGRPADGEPTEAPVAPNLVPVRDDAGDEPTDVGPRLLAESPAGAVLLAYLREQVTRMQAQDLCVRRDASDSVHQMRVATRRLRSALITFDALFETRVTRPMRKQLKWIARELGVARDAEVMRDRLRTAVERESRETAVPVGSGDILPELTKAYRKAHDRVLKDLDSARYADMLALLQALVEQPPMRKRAEAPADTVLPALVARGYDRVRVAVDAAHARPTGPERDELLHDARKAAKQVRYAGEAVVPVYGVDATRFAAAMENVQEALGERQDSVLTRARLHSLALHTESPAVAFLCGRLHAREEARMQLAEEHFEAAWKAAGRTSLHRWLR